MSKKRCSKCREWKGLDCFGKDKSRKDKKYPQCKNCQKKYRQEHKKGRNQYGKQYYREHKKERKQYRINYDQKHKKEISQNKKRYYQENKEEIAQNYQENKEEIAQKNKRYHQEHKEEANQRSRKYGQEHKKERNQRFRIRLKTDPLFRLNRCMSKAIRQIKNPSIKNGRPWKDLVPYTLIELRKHLKRTLPEGYTWEDFMQGKLDIDHILPKAIFKCNKAEDLSFQILWGLDNLRLLPSEENLRKHAKLIKPFQKHFDIEVNIKK